MQAKLFTTICQLKNVEGSAVQEWIPKYHLSCAGNSKLQRGLYAYKS